MHAYSAWNIDASQILTRGELAQVLSFAQRIRCCRNILRQHRS